MPIGFTIVFVLMQKGLRFCELVTKALTQTISFNKFRTLCHGEISCLL